MKSPKDYYETYHKYAVLNQRETFKPFTEDIKTLVSYIKTELQRSAADAWSETEWGIIKMGTGTGKSKIGVMVASHFASLDPTLTTIISVSRMNLRDNEWPNQFRQWEKEDSLPHVTIECHATTIKRSGEFIETLVVDEGHHLFDKGGAAFFRNNTFGRILILTATLPKSKLKVIKELGLPVVYDYSIEKAEADGIVSENSRYTLEVDLSDEERKAYSRACDDIDACTELCMTDPHKDHTQVVNKGKCFMLAQLVLESKAVFPGRDLHRSMKLAIAYMKYIAARKDCVAYTMAKLDAFEALANDLIIPSGDQAITFGEKTDVVDMLYDIAVENGTNHLYGKFHSNLKAKESRKYLNDFIKGNSRILLSAKALREGLDIPSVVFGISLGGNSSELDRQQEEGRTFRFELGKHAIFINIICKGTIEEGWLAKSYQGRKNKPKVFNDVHKLIQHIKDEEYERNSRLTLS